MIANSLKSGQSIRVALPLYSNAQPMVSYTIAWYNAATSEREVTSATPLESGDRHCDTGTFSSRWQCIWDSYHEPLF
ncbi:MAG: hypothetical protein GX556_00405 [Fibrobacter sp.]|nr:hypothetical protein [Fibrobacter sp.]